MKRFLTLFATSFIFIGVLGFLYADNTIALFAKKQAAESQNALLRQMFNQIESINSNLNAKLAYFRSMNQELIAKEEITRVKKLPPEEQEKALEELYEKLRAQNQDLTHKQMSIRTRSNSLKNGRSSVVPNLTTNQIISDENDGESNINDIGLYYREQRNAATSPTTDIGPDDYTNSLRQNRLNAFSDAETSPDEVRHFMRQGRG